MPARTLHGRRFVPSAAIVLVASVALGTLSVPGDQDFLAVWSSVVGSPNVGANEDVLVVNRLDSPPFDFTGLNVTVIWDYGAFLSVVASASVVPELAARGYLFDPIPEVKRVGWGPYEYDYTRESPRIPLGYQLEWLGDRASYLFIMKVMGPIATGWADVLASRGVHVLDYIPPYGYLVEMEGVRVREVMSLIFVAWLEPFHYYYRLDATLTGLVTGALDLRTYVLHPCNGPRPSLALEVPVVISGIPGVPADALERAAVGAGTAVELVSEGLDASSIIGWAGPRTLARLSRLPVVFYVLYWTRGCVGLAPTAGA